MTQPSLPLRHDAPAHTLAPALQTVNAPSSWRVSREQLAAAERARLYHLSKMAAYQARAAAQSLPPELAAPAEPSDRSRLSDARGAH